MIDAALRDAANYLAKGNLVAADICCQRALHLAPEHPVALNMMGLIATRLGLHDISLAYFERALASDRSFGPAEKNLVNAKYSAVAHATATAATNDDRFLLIKAWGYGFWSDVSHILGALLLAEITGRIPVVHWGKNSRFSDDSDDNAFEFYFQSVSEFSIEDLYHLDDASFYPTKWSKENLWLENHSKWGGEGSRLGGLYLLNRPETVVVSDFYTGIVDLLPWLPASHPLHGRPAADAYKCLIAKYLRPRNEIVAAAGNFFERDRNDLPTIAVHLRGSDKRLEMKETDEINERYLETIDKTLDPSWRIFLLTDDSRWLEKFSHAFGNRVFFADCQRTGNDAGIHYSKSADRVKLGMEIMIDSYAALRADRFIGNGQSNVSSIISLLREWPAGTCNLLAPAALLHERNLRIHVHGAE